MLYEILREIKGIEKMSYLELGYCHGLNFNNVPTKKKMSVDVNGLAQYTGTTDHFFDFLESVSDGYGFQIKALEYDIIFIDANHNWDFILRDFNNSTNHCSKLIFLHDMIPPSKEYIQENLCSDGYKVLYYLMTETKTKLMTLNEDYGLTCVFAPFEKIDESKFNSNLTYEQFLGFMQGKQLYNRKDIIQQINGGL